MVCFARIYSSILSQLYLAGAEVQAMGSKDLLAEDSAASALRADDFKRIQGIGPVIEAHLHDAGIRTYAQLAMLTPEDIVRLAENLPLLSVERIARQDWPGQARLLAAQLAAAEAGEAEDAPELRQRYATFTVELLLDKISQIRRTSVMHIQDGEESSWAGWDPARLMGFFAEYAAIQAPSTALEPTSGPAASRVTEPDLANSPAANYAVAALAPPQPDAPSVVSPATDGATALDKLLAGEPLVALRVEVGDIMLAEVELEHAKGGPPQLRRLRARLDFRLMGTEAAQVAAEGTFYTLHLIACNLAMGETSVLAVSRDRLVSGQTEYAPAVEFALPEDGRYQLVGIVLVPDERVVGHVLGPILRVTQ